MKTLPPIPRVQLSAKGETEFAFEVVLEDGSTTLFHVMTDETTVGAALLDLGLIEGDEANMDCTSKP